MLEIDTITSQVLRNCTICDSHHAGLFSVCGLAMRLRDLYKWEHRLAPWVEMESSEILDWIGQREEMWDTLTEEDFHEITILDTDYDPFDTNGINALLEPHGLFYGAGYVHSLKPSFLLAYLDDKKEINGYPVYILGRELARDLLAIPALSQDNCIFIRKESVKLFLWNQMFFLRKSAQHPLRFALENYGIKAHDTQSLRDNLDRISAAETKIFIYHEMGEIRDTHFNRDTWREILAVWPHTPIELLARVVKDLLADTNEYGTLHYIMKERKTASLGFYVTFLDGLRKELFPELIEAFRNFTKTGSWRVIEQAVSSGHNTARQYAETMCGIYLKAKATNDMKRAKDELERRLLAPLGIAGNRGAEP